MGLELLAPGPNRETERSEFENNYFKYTALAVKLINDRSPRSSVTDTNNQGNEMTRHLSRIAQLEAELSAQREFELSNLRELVARSTTPSEDITYRRHFPLPKLDLPVFSGGYEEWLGFRDAFTAMIHDDATIPKVLKLRYLRAYLKDEAAGIIDNLETSHDTYDEAWDLLKERYDNERIIIQNHMQAIFDLPVVSKESASCIRNLYDTVLRHVRAIKVLKEPTDKWDTPLVCLIASKLDKETQKQWETSVTGNKMPTFNQLTDFLRKRCQVLETLNPGSSDQNKQNTRSGNKSQGNNDKKSFGKSFINTQSNQTCLYCNKNHFIYACSEFSQLSIQERKQAVKKKGLCFNCLKRNHLISDCRSGNCTICNKRHHSLLHFESKTESTSDQTKEKDNTTQFKNLHMMDASGVMLSSAIIDIIDTKGGKHTCRVLLDSSSQPNIMTENFANRLKLRRNKLEASIEVVNSHEVNSTEWVIARFQSKTTSYSAKLSFLVLPQITSYHPSIPINKEILKIPNHIKLSDPDFDKPAKIDALIGAEIFYDLLCRDRIPLALPRSLLQSTKVGWIVAGKVAEVIHRHKFSCNLIRDPLSNQLEDFWKIEELAEKRYLSAEEEICEEHYSKNVQRDRTGRYMVRLPFNEELKALGSSYDMARKRFYALERKLERDPKLKALYHQFMKEYEDLHHMEPVTTTTKEGYYIPHHAVFKESSLTTKLRIVFNASAKSNSGISLNDTLMVGPTIQDGIFELILRFRLHSIVVGADIEKMYRQFLVHPDDRKFQRILWRFSPNAMLTTYQLNTVTYGTASAPFLATRCLSQLAEDEGSSFPAASAVLRNDFYVDDVLTGTDTFEEAKQLREDLILLTSRAGLRLNKWISNDSRLTDDLPNGLENLRRKLGDHQTTKTLGVNWNATEDNLSFEVNIKSENETITKRSILSQIAQLYDPLGLISPVVVYAKIEMQGLWKLKLGWDDPIPTETQIRWQIYRNQLSLLKNWKLQRAIKVSDAKDLQLHGFSDASQKAYGACIYLRSSNREGHHSILLCSKSRVSPVQIVSLPRLELCAAVLLTKLYKAVIKALKIDCKKTTFWTDSTIVLDWINKPPYKLETFEANRIAEIQNISKAADWRHVPTKENPADIISRGSLPADFLENILWKNGPTWLMQSEENWPNCSFKEREIPKSKPIAIFTGLIVSGWNLWNKYSSLTFLIRVIAHCLRFYQKLRKRTQFSGELSVIEIRAAETRIIQAVQRENFPEEVRSLSIGKKIANSSKVLKLSPILEDGLLRVGGRIKNSDMDFGHKHPILLPRSHPFTYLLVRNTHQEMFHAGINATLYATRQKYWIVDGRQTVRRIVHSCVKCCRAKPKEVSYVMGNLPKVRVTAARPFENTGVDYCGHFYVKEKRHRNRTKIKVYAAVFVCLVTKAIHIELVGDLTTESFLGCLRRFFARRGKSKALYSENATNFTGAKNELKVLHDFLNSEQHNLQIKRALSEQEIEWHFIPPRTPHFGGIWEAAVKSLKHHMRRTLGETLFTYEDLATYMCEIEAILNSRPLTPMSSDPNDMLVLTPGHFLIGHSLLTIPTQDFSQSPKNRLSAWQHIQKLKLDLWKRWYNEYLTELNVKSKWCTGDTDIVKVGTLVTIRDDNLPPLRWALGRILEVIPGKDSIVRVVKIKTANGVVERGIKRIAPLPIDV